MTMRKFLGKVFFAYCMVATLVCVLMMFLYFAKVPWFMEMCNTVSVATSHDFWASLLETLAFYVMFAVPALYSSFYFKDHGKAALKQNEGKIVCAMLILYLAMAVAGLVWIIVEG